MNEKDKQISLFGREGLERWWDQYWQGMPEFEQERTDIAYSEIVVRFDTEADLQRFSELIGQAITNKTKSIRFPYRPHRREEKLVYLNGKRS